MLLRTVLAAAAVALIAAPAAARGAAAGAREIAYTVDEEAPASLIIGQVVRDATLAARYNKTELSHLRFTLLKRPEFLSIDEESGALTILTKLDREDLCRYERRNSPCVLTADLMVRGPSRPYEMLKIYITVADVNDNAPVFDKNTSYLLLSEGSAVGTPFPLPVAMDADTDQYGIGDYKLQTHTDAFDVVYTSGLSDQKDLSLVLVRPLDREQRDSYQLVLLAIDKGVPPRTGSTIIEVVVLDENDNAPLFNKSIYAAAVPESTQPGSVIASVKAFDPDAGNNGYVRYNLSPTASAKVRGLFDVALLTGDIKLKGALDREDVARHLVPVVASDSADIPRSSTVYVNVTVLDINDNAPELKLSILTDSGLPEVMENAPNGTFLALLTVSDGDAGQNSVITCRLNSPKFALMEYYNHEYQIIVNSILDRESEAQPSIVVRCMDGGVPSLVTQIILKVNVLDVNDNAPIFDNRFYYSLPIAENSAVGIQVLQVHATDNDVGVNAELRYFLGTERDASSFDIDPLSGIIRTKTTLDREVKQDYAFTVGVSDRGSPALSSSAVVLVHVDDVNDNAPRFEMSHYVMRVTENQAKFTVVGKVKAADPDEGRNGEVWYRLEDDSVGPFVIAHNTGILSTRAILDREQIADYQITVVATDYGTPFHSTTVRVTVTVKDENDNEPFVVYPTASNNTIVVPVGTAVNATLAIIKAVDLDVGDNGRVGYFISSGNKEGLFRLCRETGELQLVKDIYAAVENRYLLSIGVFDHGVKPNTVFTSLTIISNKTGPLSDSRNAEAITGTHVSIDFNLIIVITLSSLSGVLSLVLIIAIVRIRKQTRENHSYNCRAEVQRLFGQKTPPPSDRISPSSGRSPNNSTAHHHHTGRGYVPCSPFADPCDSYGEGATLQRRLTTFGPDGSSDVRQLCGASDSSSGGSNSSSSSSSANSSNRDGSDSRGSGDRDGGCAVPVARVTPGTSARCAGLDDRTIGTQSLQKPCRNSSSSPDSVRSKASCSDEVILDGPSMAAENRSYRAAAVVIPQATFYEALQE